MNDDTNMTDRVNHMTKVSAHSCLNIRLGVFSLALEPNWMNNDNLLRLLCCFIDLL